MLDNVYNAKIIEYAGNIERTGRLKAPDATAKAHSKLCGSTVVVDLKMADGPDGSGGKVVTDFAHEVKACALGQASSSIMARTIIGATADELKALKKTMYAMLKDDGPPPEGRFAEFRFLEPVRDYKARHASTLLTFDAVVDCIEQIEAAEKTAKARDKQARTEKREKATKAAVHALGAAGIKFRVR
ncbi:iron-sulfur cluster assembly scaffold protein [Salaquimonas pukyongi]|uniref:iron-sulfur cluster assembly scaffold protein n=1 Tax=Salaquimonas pukyongi TaxID=2712698 RepID=UPI0009F8B457|nr:iron-sulfur cluster assembly scaffold protein [Salaquimonas pukyongi]